ncbi:hypothetical protein CF326_g10018 [Tilletia indica]|nr:hypothetical protein CF326_g10018 [Tilletia indica]
MLSPWRGTGVFIHFTLTVISRRDETPGLRFRPIASARASLTPTTLFTTDVEVEATPSVASITLRPSSCDRPIITPCAFGDVELVIIDLGTSQSSTPRASSADREHQGLDHLRDRLGQQSQPLSEALVTGADSQHSRLSSMSRSPQIIPQISLADTDEESDGIDDVEDFRSSLVSTFSRAGLMSTPYSPSSSMSARSSSPSRWIHANGTRIASRRPPPSFRTRLPSQHGAPTRPPFQRSVDPIRSGKRTASSSSSRVATVSDSVRSHSHPL